LLPVTFIRDRSASTFRRGLLIGCWSYFFLGVTAAVPPFGGLVHPIPASPLRPCAGPSTPTKYPIMEDGVEVFKEVVSLSLKPILKLWSILPGATIQTSG
jgi:hypothetical protein